MLLQDEAHRLSKVRNKGTSDALVRRVRARCGPLHVGHKRSAGRPWLGSLITASIGTVGLVGLGAVGSGAVWCLSRLQRISGSRDASI